MAKVLLSETCSVEIVSANTLQRAHQDRPHLLTHSYSITGETLLLVRSSCPMIKLYTDAQRRGREYELFVLSELSLDFQSDSGGLLFQSSPAVAAGLTQQANIKQKPC